jgi:hypothetical protein
LAPAIKLTNQFTPMLLVYHARLGLSTATLEALFGALSEPRGDHP